MAHKDISPPITICEKSNKTKVPQLRSNHPIVVLLNVLKIIIIPHVFQSFHQVLPKFRPNQSRVIAGSSSCCIRGPRSTCRHRSQGILRKMKHLVPSGNQTWQWEIPSKWRF